MCIWCVCVCVSTCIYGEHTYTVCSLRSENNFSGVNFPSSTYWVLEFVWPTLLPLLSALCVFCFLFIPSLDTNCLLLLAVWTVLGAASVCLVCFCLFPDAEELLYHSGTPGVLLENPSGCVFLPCSFLELSNSNHVCEKCPYFYQALGIFN